MSAGYGVGRLPCWLHSRSACLGSNHSVMQLQPSTCEGTLGLRGEEKHRHADGVGTFPQVSLVVGHSPASDSRMNICTAGFAYSYELVRKYGRLISLPHNPPDSIGC